MKYIVKIHDHNFKLDPGNTEIHKGDRVVVKENEHLELGIAENLSQELAPLIHDKPTYKVLRKATPADLDQLERKKAKDHEAFLLAKSLVEKLKLPMRLSLAEYTFDLKKVIIYFTAENRVDFRELLKELTTQLRGVRIELKQVGAREEARQFGGLGPCGRVLCCSSFLKAFVPITLKMAKDQSTSLNPSKISGMCGRLMCCLSYEEDNYLTVRKALPPVGSVILTSQGKAQVLEHQVVKNSIKVQLLEKENQIIYLSQEEIRAIQEKRGGNLQTANETPSIPSSK